MQVCRRTRAAATVTGLVTVLLAMPAAGAAPAAAMPLADHEMPFPCGQEWHGSTRSGHSPSWYSIDWNAPDDLGKPMVASASGVVSRVENLGDRSYGLYAVLDHGNGESTVYAHLQAEHVTVGQAIDQGELLGRLGSSGGSTGPHLHYEQRADGQGVHPWFHDRAFEFDTTLRSRSCVDVPLAGDWDGDGDDEVAVMRRKKRGVFRLDASHTVRRVRWGSGLGQPVVGSWDGDRRSDLGVRNPLTRTFALRGDDGPVPRVSFGRVDDRAVSGDWDDDGVDDVGVWRPSRAVFRLRGSDGSVTTVPLGSVGALPVTGDWDGDGRTDLGTFAHGTFTLWLTRAGGSTWTASRSWGRAGDLPVAGDWNGDGADDLGVWRPRTAGFRLRYAPPMAGRGATLVTQRFGRPR